MRTRRFSIIAIFVLLTISGAVLAQLSGPLSGTIEPGEYHVVGDISVEQGDSLVIEPGVTMLFEGEYQFDINGYLYAVGTEYDSIKFMPAEVDVPWGGIDFNDSASDDSELGYCLITGSNLSGIYLNTASTAIANSSIINNSSTGSGGGINCYGASTPTITACIISGNISVFSGGGAACNSGANGLFSQCTITDNTSAVNGGGIVCLGGANALFTDCTIKNNTCTGAWPNGGGGGVYAESASPVFEYCLVEDNTVLYGGGFHLRSSSSLIKNCTIVNNSANEHAGGIYLYSSTVSILNSIISGNHCSSSIAGGVHFGNQQNSTVNYCNLSNNTSPNFGGTVPGGLGSITTFNANGDPCDQFHNIYLNPLFTSTAGDSAFYLSAVSPCIDAGDPASPLDPDASIADIGAMWPPAAPTPPAVLTVPGQYPNIQAAIDAALIGDTVKVSPGAYTGTGNVNLNFGGKSIVVTSLMGPSLTFIDCQNNTRAVTFSSGESSSAIFSGFTIMNGSSNVGGAIYIEAAAPTISNCVFNGNHVTSYGGAIRCYSAAPNINNCNFIDNYTNNTGGAIALENSDPVISDCVFDGNYGTISTSYGGAIYCLYSSPNISDCEFTGNHVDDLGGAVCARDGSDPVMTGCYFSGNSAQHGGAINAWVNSFVTLERCIIIGNNGGQEGGGVLISTSGCSATVINCVIVENTAQTGGGIRFRESSQTMQNCIVANNTGGGVRFDSPISTTLKHCDVFDNTGGDFTGNVPSLMGQTMLTNANGDSCDLYYNISFAPLFSADPDSLYRLTADSPCIDAGDPTSPLDPDGTIADMGAYYFWHEDNTLSGNLSGTIESGEYHVVDNIFLQVGESLTIEPGVTFLFDGNFFFGVAGYLYAVGTETDSIKFMPAHPDSVWGSINLEDHCSDSSILQYCLITGGRKDGASGTAGGGLWINPTNATIANCTITGNYASDKGGGIYIYYGYPTIIDCEISNNTCGTTAWNGFGGGIYNEGYSPVIEGCRFIGNSATCAGGAVRSQSNGSPYFKQCVFDGNTADAGSAVHAWDNASPGFDRCTFVNNISAGTGVITTDGANVGVINCIFTDNNSNGTISFSAGSANITYCDFFDNSGENFTGTPVPPELGVMAAVNANGDSCDVFSNIFLDPLFSTNPDSLYRLTADSPCIDAGDPTSPLDPDGTVADMGAYYFDQDDTNLNSVEISGLIDTGTDLVLLDDGNFATFDENATDVYDPEFDIFKPVPPPDQYLQIYFPHPEWPAILGDNFMIDTRNGSDDLTDNVKIFGIEVDTDQSGEAVELTFNIGSQLNPDYGVVLADELGNYHNLRDNNLYTFTAGEEPDAFELRIGDATAPVIGITTPQTGETLLRNTPYDLEWTYDDITPAAYTILHFSEDNGSNWTQIDSIGGSPGIYNWTTPDVYTDEAILRIKIEDWAGNFGETESGAFTIGDDTPPLVTITAPGGDELLISGDDYQITWTVETPNGLDYSLVDYSPDNGASWTRIDSVNAPLTSSNWLVPDLYSTECKIRVTAYDLFGFNSSEITGYTFNIGPDYSEISLETGWHLLSIPLIPEYASIDSIFGDDIAGAYFVYNYAAIGGYGLVYNIENGHGYWLALMENITIDLTGLPEVDSTYISIGEGWNIIGNSMPADVAKEDLYIWDGIVLTPFMSSGGISPAIFEYNTTISNYQTTDILTPWGGYWLKAVEAGLELVTYPPLYQSGTDEICLDNSELDETENKGWFVPVKLYGQEISAVISGFGVRPDASAGFDLAYDALQPPNPPGGDYLNAVFEHQEWGTPFGTRFSRDIRNDFIRDKETPEVKQWDFKIESSIQGEITVNFEKVMETIPHGYSANLEYNEVVVDLSEAHSAPVNYTQPLDLTVFVYNEAATIAGWNTDWAALNLPDKFAIESVYPNPFNPAATIKIGLPEAAKLRVDVFNISGRHVACLTDGYHQAGYHRFEFNGEMLASGVYFVKAYAPGKLNEMRKIVLVK